MLKLLVTYFLALVTNVIFAQTTHSFEISGAVISANTNEPISGATIVFASKKAVLTDSLGHFVISGLSKGQHKLFFSAADYDARDTIINIENANIDNIKWIIKINCPDFNADKAFKDIKENKANLLLYGSIAPSSGPADKEFKKTFGVTYKFFGDEGSVKEECKKLYNQVIFNYLNKRFGNKWRKDVRKDVVGLTDNKHTNCVSGKIVL